MSSNPLISELQRAMSAYTFDLKTDALGIIHCGYLTIKTLDEIAKYLNTSDTNGPALVRKLLEQVGQKNREDKSKRSEKTPLTDADTNRLSKEEIELFAGEFLTHNELLSENKNDSDLLRNEGECNSDYLLRMLKHHAGKHLERMDRFNKSMFPPVSSYGIPSTKLSVNLSNFGSTPDPIHKTNQYLDEILDRANQWHSEFNKSNRQSTCRSWIAICIAILSLLVAIAAMTVNAATLLA